MADLQPNVRPVGKSLNILVSIDLSYMTYVPFFNQCQESKTLLTSMGQMSGLKFSTYRVFKIS